MAERKTSRIQDVGIEEVLQRYGEVIVACGRTGQLLVVGVGRNQRRCIELKAAREVGLCREGVIDLGYGIVLAAGLRAREVVERGSVTIVPSVRHREESQKRGGGW